MQALHDAMKAQCARYIGMSSYYSWQCKCLATRQSACDQLTDRWIEWRVSNRRMIPEHVADEAIANDLTPFISMQNHHSLVYREEERETFPTLNHFGVGIISWSPLARGLLTRPLETDAVTTRGNTDLCVSLNALSMPSHSLPDFIRANRYATEYLEEAGTRETVNRSVLSYKVACFRSHESSDRVEEISKKRGISIAQVSLAWSLTHVTAPVVGSMSIRNLEELMRACNHCFQVFRVETNPLPLFRWRRDHVDARRN